jgi:hypothetical protein
MKKILIVFILFAISEYLPGQTDSNVVFLSGNRTDHIYKDAGFALAPVLRYNSSEGTSIAGSFKMRMFLGKRFSFDSDITLGKDFVTFGPGLLGIPFWLLGFPSESGDGYRFGELLIIGAMVLLTAEHTAYHIPLKNYTDLSPYISLLRLQAAMNDNPDNPYSGSDKICYAFGLELNKYFNKFVFSPYVEYNQAYGSSYGHIFAGAYFGLYIFKK